MSYLLDTCVLSEFSKPKRNEGVVRFFEAHLQHGLYISVLTVGELRGGILQLPAGKKRLRLERWLEEDLLPQFSDYVISMDLAVAEQWCRVTADARRNGISIGTIDGLLIATAITHDLGFVTRDVRSLRRTGARIENPWS